MAAHIYLCVVYVYARSRPLGVLVAFTGKRLQGRLIDALEKVPVAGIKLFKFVAIESFRSSRRGFAEIGEVKEGSVPERGRIHLSAIRTPASTFALSRGLPAWRVSPWCLKAR